MRTNRANGMRRTSGRSRMVTFEPLGTRIALSASGLGPFVFGSEAPSRPFEAEFEHSRALAASGEFTTLQQSGWQRASGGLDAMRTNDGPGWQQQDIFVSANEPGRGPLNRGGELSIHRTSETRIVPASVQVSGTNLVMPGLLVSRGDGLTLVITGAPFYGLAVGSHSYSQSDAREPVGGERSYAPKPLADPTALHAAATGDDTRGEHASGTNGGSMAASSGLAPPPRASDAPLAFTTIAPRSAEARASAVWATGDHPEGERELVPGPAQAAPIVGQWAISKTELDDGLIELESPFAPRRKGRKLAEDSADAWEDQQDPWAELQSLAEQAWSAWNEAWREFGRDVKSPADDAADAPQGEPGAIAGFDGGVVDGLVELAVEGGTADVLPPQVREHLADRNAPVRIDADVAIFQEFEVATAAEAAPPATARQADRKAKEDERAATEKHADGQPISAAAVGAGMITGLPFSLRRRPADEDEQQLARLRTK